MENQEQELKDINMKLQDVEWLIKIRQTTDIGQKLEMIIKKCPCCVERIVRSLFILSDKELETKQSIYQQKVLDLISINDINI